MKGLLIKEWIEFQTKGNIVFSIVLLIMYGIFLKFIPAFMICCVLLSSNMMSSDVRCGWNRYAAALPINRANIIKSKTAVSVFTELGFIAGILLASIFGCIIKAYGAGQFLYDLFIIAFLLSASSIMQLLIFHIGVRLGSRIGTIITVILTALFLYLLDNVISISLLYGAIALLSAVTIRIISIFLSIAAYERRDL